MKKFFVASLSLLLFFALSACSSNTPTNKDTSPESGNNSPKAVDNVKKEETPNYKEYKVGEVFKVDTFKFKINSWYETNELSMPSDLEQPPLKTDGKFIVVDCTATNLDDRVLTVGADMFRINGHTPKLGGEFMVALNGKDLFTKPMYTHESCHGQFVVELPANETTMAGYDLHVSPDENFTKYVTVKL